MRCLGALAVLGGLLTQPAAAQRGFGGSHAGGFAAAPGRAGGGFAGAGRGFAGAGRGYTAPGAGASFARPGFAPGARFARPGYPGFRNPPFSTSPFGTRYRSPLSVPGNFHRDRPFLPRYRPSPGYRFRGPLFLGSAPFTFAYPGPFDLGSLGPLWDGYNAGVAQPAYVYDPEALGYPVPGATPGGDADPSADADPAMPAETQPPTSGTPEGSAPYPPAEPLVYSPDAPSPSLVGDAAPPRVTLLTTPAPPRENEATLLFFVDGRPPEQIRNYALTRTAILITDGRMREIPLSDINLPLTIRVNQALGIEFRPPGMQ